MRAPDLDNGIERKKDRLLELEQELELLKQVLLREIIAQTKAGAEVNEDLLKKIKGYLRVVKRLAEVIHLRNKEPDIENAPSVRTVWEVLKEIPSISNLLSDPQIKAQILKQIRERLKGQPAGGEPAEPKK